MIKTFKEFISKSDAEEGNVNESTIKGMTPKKLKLTATKDLAAHTKKVTGKESLSSSDIVSPKASPTKYYLKDGKKLGITNREGKIYLTGLEVR